MKTQIIFIAICLFLVICVSIARASMKTLPRDSWQQPTKIMDAIGIKTGMIIGEAGAGEGYFTFHLSSRVGKTGKVYANDIKRSVLKEIEKRCAAEGISNIVTQLGKVADPLFPAGKLDMVVMMRALHDFEEPVEWMKNVVTSLKPGGRLVIIDLEPDKAKYGWDHFLTKKALLAIMEKTDFNLVKIETFLERDNIYIYNLPLDTR